MYPRVYKRGGTKTDKECTQQTGSWRHEYFQHPSKSLHVFFKCLTVKTRQDTPESDTFEKIVQVRGELQEEPLGSPKRIGKGRLDYTGVKQRCLFHNSFPSYVLGKEIPNNLQNPLYWGETGDQDLETWSSNETVDTASQSAGH